MSEQYVWHSLERGLGRLYQRPEDLQVVERYDDVPSYIRNIAESLKNFIQIETSIRFTVDSPYCNAMSTTLSIPTKGDLDKIYVNLATLIYQKLWGYYLSADPKATHHGFTTLILEGQDTSIIRREAERNLSTALLHNEVAGRLMRDFHLVDDMPEFRRDTFYKDSFRKCLSMHVGVRIYNFGPAVQRLTVFFPISGGENIIDQIYYNLESIILQRLGAYDDLHDRHLPVREELLYRELENVLNQVTTKTGIRRRLINKVSNIQTLFLNDVSDIYKYDAADLYYDKLNRIDLMDEAAQRSRELLESILIQASEVTRDAGVEIDGLSKEEHVYIERPSDGKSREEIASTAEVKVESHADAALRVSAEDAAAKPSRLAAEPESAEEEKEVVYSDGLQEL